MNRPVHFEIHASDPEKAKTFYESVFGWQFTQWGGPVEYWIVQTGEGTGIDGGMIRSQDGAPRTVNTVEVGSVDEFARKVTAAGGQVVVPKMPITGVGWVAYCTDPGGVIFGIHEADPTVK
ncbi:MAG: VOC family protein [Planctomycetes bacterium]|nr:VOC family protein [Planctomycetota bacterium]